MPFCRQGQRLYVASSKNKTVVNATFFQTLWDIAIRTHDQMSRKVTLGPGEIRYKVRMFMYTQYVTNMGVSHTGASGMRMWVFEMVVGTLSG